VGTIVVSYSITIPDDDLTVTGLSVQMSLAAWSPMQVNDAITTEVDEVVGSGVFSIVVISVTEPSLSTSQPEDGLASGASTCMVPAATNALAAALVAYAMRH